MRYAAIKISQNALKHNLSTLKSRSSAKLLAMVKANAYGHGLAEVVPHLTQADGFGTAFMAEALAVKKLLAVKDTRPIVLMEGVFSQNEWQQAIACDFMTVIHHAKQVDFALQTVPDSRAKSRTLWLKFNTGMNRLGFCQTQIKSVAAALIAKGYRLILSSHFACADDKAHPLNAQQIECFVQVYQSLRGRFGELVQASLCNSAGLLNFPACHYDWVRLGIALYGSSPVLGKSASDLNLQAVMTLCAKVMTIHSVAAGESVGYGALWTPKQAVKLGIVSIGYGDGYPRTVQGAKVAIGGRCYPIAGRVAMDMLAVDLGDNAAAVAIGDSVELWGNTIGVDDVAAWSGTLGYELLCRTTNRPLRIEEV